MTLPVRVEAALKAAIDRADTPSAPPGLIKALRYAVFPGGARVRPMLCLAVARACGDDMIDGGADEGPMVEGDEGFG
jgi:geranylgeranyl diphosphate synthase type II